MNPISEAFYQVKRFLLGALGPATLDAEHDPVEQAQRAHEQQDRPAAPRDNGAPGSFPPSGIHRDGPAQ